MEIKTFDTILNELCDVFDSLITPKKIARTNANIIYLLFKALAKGFEIINNVCVVLSYKFDPRNCDSSDLESSASLVGTERYKGSGSGLKITITNNGETPCTLLQGIYNYKFNDDVTFSFEILEETEIRAGSYITVIAMSENIGRFLVTAQPDIEVTSIQDINSDLAFSCADNSALLGALPETDLELRERILTRVDRQNNFVELETVIKNLPYIFDCQIKYNNDFSPITYDDIVIPSQTALICYSGAIKEELADKVCEHIICPTVQTEDSKEVKFYSDVFVNGFHPVYFTPFKKTQYQAEVILKVEAVFVDFYSVTKEIRATLFNNFISEVHTDYVKEEELYNVIKALNLTGVNILGLNLIYNGDKVNFIEVPLTRIPELTDVTFIQE
jgi:hypothetical protein